MASNQAAEADAACRSIIELRLEVQFGSINERARISRRSLAASRYTDADLRATVCGGMLWKSLLRSDW